MISVCKNGDWLCPNGTADIRCPLNQMYRRNITTCGYTCSTYDFRQQCPKDTPKFDGCGCLPGTVMLTNVSSSVPRRFTGSQSCTPKMNKHSLACCHRLLCRK